MGAIPGPLAAGAPYDDRGLFKNNVDSTLNLFLSAAEHKLKRIVFSSSAFVWFTYAGRGDMSEQLPWHDNAKASAAAQQPDPWPPQLPSLSASQA